MSEAVLGAVADAIDEARLWRLHEEFAAIGGTSKGGVCREALTPEDMTARIKLADLGRELGCTVGVDAIGNMFLRREGRKPDAAPVATGSHLDTQPTGGRFDGAYGVLAGVELFYALRDAGIETERPIEVINFTNEEGGRYAPGVMGSQVFADPDQLKRMLAAKAPDGGVLGGELGVFRQKLGPVEDRPFGTAYRAFVEGHIEQAPLLEETGNTVGVVTGIQGSRKFQIEVIGEEAHAGTMPRRRRKDALIAATHMVQALYRLMEDEEDTIRFTIGRFQAFPGAPSVVPGRVAFTCDFRHPSNELRARLGDQIEGLCKALAGPCGVEVNEYQSSVSVDFHGPMLEAVRRSAARLGVPHMDMYSGAGHDARNMARLCPSAMVFVPCERGISHNEAENAKASDLAAGTRVIAQAVTELALD